jgi:Na+/proline symporter
MRFIWQTVPLMGVAWFLAILWRRANRWGAIASFVAAVIATSVAKFVYGWEGDAGLPATILLYLVCAILAGIVVSLLTPAESPERTAQFFLLLNTPIGQEQILREAGFRQTPGHDTFEMPEPTKLPSGTADEDNAGRTLRRIVELVGLIEKRQSRREAIIGVVVLILVVVAMIAGVLLLANWLSP